MPQSCTTDLADFPCRWLEMILLEAEAAWAGAMEIKQSMDASGVVHTNQRRHYLRRFAKARKWAQTLADAAAATAEDWTVVSCDAYSSLARALELSEKVCFASITSCACSMRDTACCMWQSCTKLLAVLAVDSNHKVSFQACSSHQACGVCQYRPDVGIPSALCGLCPGAADHRGCVADDNDDMKA